MSRQPRTAFISKAKNKDIPIKKKSKSKAQLKISEAFSTTMKKEPHNAQLIQKENNLRNYECPICLNILRPPTLLCPNGHYLCSTCKYMVKSCPLCSAEYLTIKNTTFDDVLKKLKVPCLGSPQGCTAVYTSGLLDIHEQHCPWMNTVVCCVSECNKSVLEAEYCSHIEEKHTADMVSDISLPITVHLDDFLVKLNGFRVIFVRENSTGQLFEIHILENVGGFQVAAKQLGCFVLQSYEVVYNIRQEQSILPITKQLYSAPVRREVMFGYPHLSIDEAQGPYDISVVIQKSKLPITQKGTCKQYYKVKKNAEANVRKAGETLLKGKLRQTILKGERRQ